MISRRQFGYVLPVVQLSVPPVLYVSQFLFGSFTPGVILLLVPAAGFLPLYLFLRKKGSVKGVKELVFSKGFYALLALVCIYFVIDLKRSLVKWDELMHWGMMVKEMFRLDRFYAVPESNLLMHKDYPPFAPLLELFWCRLCGGFKMSLVLGPVSEMAGDEAGTSGGEAETSGPASKARVTVGLFGRQLLLAPCIMLIILSFDGFHIFMTIYTDIMIAAVFGYTTCLVFTGRVFRSGWSLLACTLGINALLQIKEVGIGFFLLAAVLCPANLLYFIPQKLHGNPRYPFRQYAEKLTAAVPPASRVFLIADSKVNDYQLFIAYYANELRISMEYIDAFSYRYSEDPKLKDQVLNSMAENDYVYVIHSNASLKEAFADVTSDGPMKGDTLYKVKTAGGTVRLQAVGSD